MDALCSLDGYVDAELKEFKKGLFVVSLKEKSWVRPADVEKNIAGFELAKVKITVVVSAADDGKMLTLVARGSGTKIEIQRDPTSKTDTSDEVRKLLKDGKSTVRVSGTLKEVKLEDKKTKFVIEIEKAEAVEPKKK